MPEEMKPPAEGDQNQEPVKEGGGEQPKEGGEQKPPAETPKDDENFDINNIDPDVLNYAPAAPKDDADDNEYPEDKARIQKIVDRTIGGKVSQLEKQVAVNGYFNEHPEFGKYRGAVDKYLAHPNYSGLPIHNIVAIVAAKDMQKIGAAKEREAARKAAETAAPGTSVRTTPVAAVDWDKATREELVAQQAKVLGRQGA